VALGSVRSLTRTSNARPFVLTDRSQSPRLETVPDEALSVVRTCAGPLLVDLDETLYLRNSTEHFIDTAIPAPLALLVMRVLDAFAGAGPAATAHATFGVSRQSHASSRGHGCFGAAAHRSLRGGFAMNRSLRPWPSGTKRPSSRHSDLRTSSHR
jgi:hypothetical protein